MISVKDHDLKRSYDEFGRGEIACIEVCREQDLILMDDRKAKEFAHKRGKSCFDLPTFLYTCNKKEIIDQAELKEIIKELKEKDYYELSSEVRELLLG